MEQIFLWFGFPKETITTFITLYKNTKVTVRSFSRDIDFFDIVAGVLQDTFASYLFIICLTTYFERQ